VVNLDDKFSRQKLCRRSNHNFIFNNTSENCGVWKHVVQPERPKMTFPIAAFKVLNDVKNLKLNFVL
jgi:hypothetical protein